MLKYRSDIDGLRAIAVVLVILFHAGLAPFSAGFLGVDIFFVISGFLITQIIYKEMTTTSFTFASFYKRRIVRLLPALNLTLLAVFLYGFVVLDNKAFDILGKETFFSALGLVNLHYAQGANYFDATDAVKPLIHLWSLGVEEQYYLVWPLLLLVLAKLPPRFTLVITALLLLVSLVYSELAAVGSHQTHAYYLPQFRAFELLIGSLTALVLHINHGALLQQNPALRRGLFYLGLIMILASLIALNKASTFPGINALWACLGTALIIAFPQPKSAVSSVLSSKAFVSVGLISYPLYLFHQPALFFLNSIGLDSIDLSSNNFAPLRVISAPMMTFVLTMAIATPLAWLTYKKIELPIRNAVRAGKHTLFIVWGLVAVLLGLAVLGLFTAKSGGIPQRFQWLNAFAHQTAQVHQSPFHMHYGKGAQISEQPAQALFIGDSTLQNYVHPIKNAYGFEQVDMITRGGCVLLKGVEFEDKFNDISCDDIRQQAYENTKHYDVVFISQSWNSYRGKLLNAEAGTTTLTRWDNFIKETVQHFTALGSEVYVIAWHPEVNYNTALSPNLKLTPASYQTVMAEQVMTNVKDMEKGKAHFEQLGNALGFRVIHPMQLFCETQCVTHSQEWSYFSDEIHFTVEGANFVESVLRKHHAH